MQSRKVSSISSETPEYQVHNYDQINSFYELRKSKAKADIFRVQSEARYRSHLAWKETLPGISLLTMAIGFLAFIFFLAM